MKDGKHLNQKRSNKTMNIHIINKSGFLWFIAFAIAVLLLLCYIGNVKDDILGNPAPPKITSISAFITHIKNIASNNKESTAVRFIYKNTEVNFTLPAIHEIGLFDEPYFMSTEDKTYMPQYNRAIAVVSKKYDNKTKIHVTSLKVRYAEGYDLSNNSVVGIIVHKGTTLEDVMFAIGALRMDGIINIFIIDDR